jgi:predicted amidophosphoribosyltransferase
VELVTKRCADLVALEKRLDELDGLIASVNRRSGLRCECGAPLAWGAHFCANCGRPVGPRPVVSCARCGAPLPAEAKFCGSCGSTVEQQPEVPADTQADPAPKERAEV